jgi:hypothetical protein
LRVAFAVTALALFGYEIVWGAEWKFYGMNEEGSYFYDTGSMARLSESIVRVYVKSVYTEMGIFHWVSGGGEEFHNLDFSLIMSDFNCVERSIRYRSIIFYSKNGEVFHPISNDEWHFFAPDSMSGTLLKEICE